MANVFQPITEQFIWGFMAQDVIALWIPRIINALRRGRVPYRPDEDPHIRERSALQQFLHSMYVNIKGLNYPNAKEETGREVETGPGLIIAQSFMYGLATAFVMGKMALVMGRNELHEYTHAFKEMVKKLPQGTFGLKDLALEKELTRQFLHHELDGFFKPSNPAELRKILEGLVPPQKKGVPLFSEEKLASLLKDELKYLVKLPKHTSAAELKALDPAEAMLRRFVAKHVKHAGKTADGLYQFTFKDFADAWIKEYVEATADKSIKKMPFQARMARLLKNLVPGRWHPVLKKRHWTLSRVDNLEAIFERAVFHYTNRMPHTVKRPELLNIMKLRSLGKFHHGKLHSGHFLAEMYKFRTFISDVSRSALKNVPENQMTKGLQKIADTVMKRTMVKKGLMSVLATLLAGFTVIYVSKKAQSGHSYPANRLLQLSAEQEAVKKAQGHHGGFAGNHHARPQFAAAGLTHQAAQQAKRVQAQSVFPSHQMQQLASMPAVGYSYAANSFVNPRQQYGGHGQ